MEGSLEIEKSLDCLRPGFPQVWNTGAPGERNDKSSFRRMIVVGVEVIDHCLFLGREDRAFKGGFLHLPEPAKQVISGKERDMMREKVNRRKELISVPGQYPPKLGLYGSGRARWTRPPAVQECSDKDVNAEQEIDSARTTKMWVCQLQTSQMIPG